jgi:hypothetical protein
MTYARSGMAIVEVVWIDSNSLSGWHNLTTIEEDTGNEMECRSTGYLFRDNEDCVTLIQSTSETGMFAAMETIPRCAIQSVTVLRQALL